MMPHSQSGVSGMISGMGRGGSSATRLRTASAEGARNGGRPLTIWYSTLPRLNRSARWSIVVPEGLLRGHEHRRAGDDAALRDAGVVGGAGQAEVGDLRLVRPAFEQDVARLDVAVDQVTRMGRGQPLGDLPADPQHLGHVERAAPVEFLLERLAGDELHHQVGERLFADLVDLHHVLVPNLPPRNGLRAGSVCGRATVAANLRGHHLTATTRCNMSSKARKTMPKPPLPSTWSTS